MYTLIRTIGDTQVYSNTALHSSGYPHLRVRPDKGLQHKASPSSTEREKPVIFTPAKLLFLSVHGTNVLQKGSDGQDESQTKREVPSVQHNITVMALFLQCASHIANTDNIFYAIAHYFKE